MARKAIRIFPAVALMVGAASAADRGTRVVWESNVKEAAAKAVLRNVPLLFVFSADG